MNVTPRYRNFSTILFVVLVTLPVFSGLVYALLYSLGFIGILSTGFTTKAWETILLGKPFWSSLGFSFYIAIVTILISLAVSLSIAISWRKNLNKGALSSLIYLPLCFPGTVMAFFSYQTLSKSGLLSRIVFQIGWIDDLRMFPAWINDAYGIGIIITSVLLITPFFIILFSNVYTSEKVEEYVQLAKTFGASKRQVLLKVTLPILLKKASVTIYLFIIFVMGSYEVPLLLGRQDPQMISVAILQKIQKYNLYDIPKGYAMSVLYVVLVISVLFILYRKNKTFFTTETSN